MKEYDVTDYDIRDMTDRFEKLIESIKSMDEEDIKREIRLYNTYLDSRQDLFDELYKLISNY